METYANEVSRYCGRHLWNKTWTPKLNSTDVGEENLRSYKLPFWLANLFANKGDP
jgi:hypothetical protein